MDLKKTMGGWRADVATYEGGKPTAVIEIKIHDEGRRGGLALRDLNKVREIRTRTGIKTYLAVLVTATSRTTCQDRATALGQFLKQLFNALGEPVVAGEGRADWSWLFACGAFI